MIGDDLSYGLPFAKTIFLLEDVDAACDVVKVPLLPGLVVW